MCFVKMDFSCNIFDYQGFGFISGQIRCFCLDPDPVFKFRRTRNLKIMAEEFRILKHFLFEFCSAMEEKNHERGVWMRDPDYMYLFPDPVQKNHFPDSLNPDTNIGNISQDPKLWLLLVYNCA